MSGIFFCVLGLANPQLTTIATATNCGQQKAVKVKHVGGQLALLATGLDKHIKNFEIKSEKRSGRI